MWTQVPTPEFGHGTSSRIHGVDIVHVRQRSHLVLGHGALVRYSLGTNVNTPFSQVPTLKFGHGAGARVQDLDLVPRHKSGYRVLVCRAFLFSSLAVHCFVLSTKLMFRNDVRLGEMDLLCTQSYFGYSRCEHSTILCRYPSTGSRALSVDSP